MFNRYSFKKNAIGGEIARFSFHVWSLDDEVDSMLTKRIMDYDRETDLYNEISKIVSEQYFPFLLNIVDYQLKPNGSIFITFAIVLAGLINVYQLIAQYDDFRNSLYRVTEDIKRLLFRISGARQFPERTMIDGEWTPGDVLARVEKETIARPSINYINLLTLYLAIMNLILVAVLIVLVFRSN